MSPLRILYLIAVHAVPVVYLLRGGLTPLDALVLSWAEGFVAILLNRVRLASLELRGQSPGLRVRRRRQWLKVVAELARSVAGGLALYAFLGVFVWLAIVTLAGNAATPWTVGSKPFWVATGWMALAVAVEVLATVLRSERPGGPVELFDKRTRWLLLRFVADQVLLVSGAVLVVGFGAATLAVVMLVAAKVAVDIAAEWWGERAPEHPRHEHADLRRLR
jgi:hypothetical protein